MTEEEIRASASAQAEADKRVADIVNAAVTSHLKRSEKSQAEFFSKLLEEKLKTLVPPPAEEKEKAASSHGKPSPEMAAMQQKLDDLAKLTNEANERATKAEEKRREEHTYGTVRSLLKDVRPELQEVAARDLFYSQKRITYDEQGKALFKGRRIPAPGMAEEEVDLPLQDGISQWLKSKEAAPFLPAPNSGVTHRLGSRAPAADAPTGSHRGANGLPTWDKEASTDEEKALRSMELEESLATYQARQGRS